MNYSKPTIVVFGATGTIGAEVLKELNKRACFVRGVLRNVDRKVPVVLDGQNNNITYIAVNLNSKEEIKRACVNSDAIFLLTGTSPNQISYETNIIEVAEALNIERIVKLSAPVLPGNAHVEVGDWHRKIEERLASSTIDYCFLQPHSFMQNWERNTFTIKYFGKIFGAMKNAKRNYVDARDVAEIAVHYLLKSSRLNGEGIVIAGPEAISHQSMAERISHVTNKNVVYEDISGEEYLTKLTKQAKLPTWLARHLVEIDVLATKHPEPTKDTVEAILNRKPRIMDAYLQESRDLFTAFNWRFFK